MLENPVLTLSDSVLQKSNSVATFYPQHAASVHANPPISMTRSDSHRIIIPGGKRRVESVDPNSTVEAPSKRSDDVPYDPSTSQQTTTKRRSMYIPHKSQPAVPTTKPHIPPPSTFNPELMQSKLTMSLSITHIPVSIPTYRSCITCLTPISVFDAGDICTTCRLSLSAPINKNLQAPQSPSDANSPTKVAMSAFLDGQDNVERRRSVQSSMFQLVHPAEFDISPTHQSIAGPSIPSKRRKVSHNPDPDENPGQSVDELNQTSVTFSTEGRNNVVAMVYPIQPSIVVEKSEGAGILKLGRGRSSVGAKKVSWADISGDGCLEMGPSKATSSVKAKQLDRSLESTLVEGQRRPLTIKIKPLQSLSPNKSYDTDVIEGWDSDLTELSESGNESSSDNDVPISSLQTQPTQPSTGLKIRLPPRTRNLNIRRCASSRCKAELPSDYRWKSCVLCRSRNREYQRKRQNLQGRHWRLDDELTNVQDSPSATMAVIETSTIEGARLCLMRHCSFIIPPIDEYSSKFCSLCRLFRKSKKALGMNLTSGSVDGANSARLAFTAALPDAPEYLTLKPLLADLRSRARAFLRTQALFFLFNEPTSPGIIKAAFGFEGEYTTVNPDLEFASQKDDIYAKIIELKKVIEQQINLQFGPEEGCQCDEDGFRINFLCSLKVPVLRAAKSGDAVEIKLGTKEMIGELKISVLRDKSHPFIPGEKIIIRFEMMG
ncbi:hypothetical protein BJ165DRAFT_1521035 [Panaeolus papilionaceus]|nr:hypothetical protein BJ165DRAFT_1521035 [Panaeolus papilionaceus]